MVPVTLVYAEGKAALVQWVERGKMKRAIVPAGAVKDGEIDAVELEAGLPYGEDWTQVKGVNAAVAEELRKRGVWTKEDALSNGRYVHDAVIVGLVPPTLQAIMDYARED